MLRLFLIIQFFAHPYLPLKEGVSTTANYSFEVQTERKEFRQANTKGTIKVKAEKWETQAGKNYLKFVTSYQGIPFMKEDATLWRREENGNVYIASENKGVFSESMELPSNIDIGAEWNYNDGVNSKRKVTARVKVELPGGEKIDDCIEITRVVLNNPSLKDLTDKSIYCRDRGNVRTLFIQPSPVGDYRTETVQQSKSGG